MCIARCGLEIGVPERLLYQLEIAGLAQELGAEVVAEVVEAEVGHPCPPAQIAPVTFQPVVRDRIALALDTAVAGALGDESEDKFRVVPLQRPEDFMHGGCDWLRYQPPTLAELSDLARAPVDLIPPQQAFL